MKALVAVKRVVDYNVKVRVNAEGNDVDIKHCKMSMNPFCEIALEEAVRLKEQGKLEEILVVSIGEAKSEEQLRAALALGADRALLVQSEPVSSLTVAKVLAQIVEKEHIDLVLLGKQSIDSDHNQTAQMLAGLLDCAQLTFASEVSIVDQQLQVSREVDSGTLTLKSALPAVISADLRLNEPRFAKLPDIMKAKRKPLETRTLADFSLKADSQLMTLSVREPEKRQGGIKVDSVEQLVDKLKHDAKVIE